MLDATPVENTDRGFAESTLRRLIENLPAATEHLDTYGDVLAADLLDSHRRVRSAAGEIVRGVSVTALKPADVLGAFVYLPATGGNA